MFPAYFQSHASHCHCSWNAWNGKMSIDTLMWNHSLTVSRNALPFVCLSERLVQSRNIPKIAEITFTFKMVQNAHRFKNCVQSILFVFGLPMKSLQIPQTEKMNFIDRMNAKCSFFFLCRSAFTVVNKPIVFGEFYRPKIGHKHTLAKLSRFNVQKLCRFRRGYSHFVELPCKMWQKFQRPHVEKFRDLCTRANVANRWENKQQN